MGTTNVTSAVDVTDSTVVASADHVSDSHVHQDTPSKWLAFVLSTQHGRAAQHHQSQPQPTQTQLYSMTLHTTLTLITRLLDPWPFSPLRRSPGTNKLPTGSLQQQLF